MRTIKVTWEDGDTTITNINGTDEQIRQYYLNQVFNLGRGPDDYLVRAVSVEFLD